MMVGAVMSIFWAIIVLVGAMAAFAFILALRGN